MPGSAETRRGPRPFRWAPAALLLLAVLSPGLPDASGETRDAAPATPPRGAPPPSFRQLRDLESLPLRFEPNVGQADPAARFVARCPGFLLFLGEEEATFAFRGASPDPAGAPRAPSGNPAWDDRSPILLRMRFGAGETGRRWEAGARLPGVSNYLLGRDRSLWRTGVPCYGGVEARGVAPGVDLRFGGAGNRLAYEFTVAAGADSSGADIEFEGATSLTLDAAGSLLVATAAGVMRHSRPVLVQETAAGERRAPGAFLLKGGNRVGFDTAGSDPALPLVIDPEITLASYLGWSGSDNGGALAVDAAGNLYLAGSTDSLDVALAAPIQTARSGYTDAFILAFNPETTQVLFSTYLGGSGSEGLWCIDLDEGGDLLVAGSTDSKDFPGVTDPAFGKTDGIAARITGEGTDVVWARTLGGTHAENFTGAARWGGFLYVTGSTHSNNFPTTEGAVQRNSAGGFEGLVAKYAVEDGSLAFSTFLGGQGYDYLVDLAVDGAGDIFVVGHAGDNPLGAIYDPGSFPVKNAFQPEYRAGGSDGVVARLRGDGSEVIWATFLGGSSADLCRKILLNGNGDPVVAGITYSPNFPVKDAVHRTLTGPTDVFLATLRSDGTALLFSTFLGGTGDEVVGGLLAVNDSIYLTGGTTSSDFPKLNAPLGLPLEGGGWDAFFLRIRSDGDRILSSISFGWNADDYLGALTVDAAGTAFVVGTTGSSDMATSPGALQSSYGGGSRDLSYFRIAQTPPTIAPTGLGAAPGYLGIVPTVDLAWTWNGEFVGEFRIERKSGAGTFKPLVTLPGTFLQYKDATVVPLQVYTYRVRADNYEGLSPWSNEAQGAALPLPTTPLPPGEFTATPISPTAVECTWVDASGNELQFHLSRESAGVPLRLITALPADTTGYTDPGLEPDRTYLYMLAAHGTGGSFPNSPTAGATTFPTLEVRTAKGSLSDGRKAGRDRLKATGTFEFLETSPDGILDPVQEGLRIGVGEENGGGEVRECTAVLISPGDSGWRYRRGAWIWKSSKGTTPKAVLTIDPAAGTFILRLSRAEFSAPPSFPLRVSLRSGDDAGSERRDWEPRGRSRYLLR